MKVKVIMLMFFWISTIYALAIADTYRWQDEEGVIHYADDLTKVPEAYRGKAEKLAEPKQEKPAMQQRKEPARYKPEQYKPLLDNNGHGEDWWRAKVNTLKANLKAKEDELEKVKREYTGSNPESQARKRLELGNKMEAIEKEISDLKHELEYELPEEARKAGAPPGWLRD